MLHRDFNSTMVRLKVYARARACVLLVVFQFHYGTIKRFAETISHSDNPISIPLWYD